MLRRIMTFQQVIGDFTTYYISVWHSTLLVTSLKGDPFVSEGTLFGDR